MLGLVVPVSSAPRTPLRRDYSNPRREAISPTRASSPPSGASSARSRSASRSRISSGSRSGETVFGTGEDEDDLVASSSNLAKMTQLPPRIVVDDDDPSVHGGADRRPRFPRGTRREPADRVNDRLFLGFRRSRVRPLAGRISTQRQMIRDLRDRGAVLVEKRFEFERPGVAAHRRARRSRPSFLPARGFGSQSCAWMRSLGPRQFDAT